MKKLLLIVLVLHLLSCGDSSIVVMSNGVEIGTLTEESGDLYTFTSSQGYIGRINAVTGYLDYGLRPSYTTADCTGQAYRHTSASVEGSAIEYPSSTNHVWRNPQYPTKMYHTTETVPETKTMLSFWYSIDYGSCESTNDTYEALPIDEITETTSGIQVLYDTPITME